MKCYTYSGSVQTSQNFLLPIPTNTLLGKVHFALNPGENIAYEIGSFLNKSFVTLTLVDNYRSVQEVLATKLPLSFFNDLSSIGEGAVMHSIMPNGVDIMFKIPLAFEGALDLNSDKYIKVEFAFNDFSTASPSSMSVECFARQGKSMTNDCIQYKRLNIPDGVLTYDFKPNGSAYILSFFEAGQAVANIDFVEYESISGYKSRFDFYELLADYYERNEISARFIYAGSVASKEYDAEMMSIGILDTVGVDTIKIVRNDTTTDTTIVVLEKLVTKASDNAVTNGSVIKLENGTYVPNNKVSVNTAVLETVFVPQKQYAVANTIRQMASAGSIVKTGGSSSKGQLDPRGVFSFMK